MLGFKYRITYRFKTMNIVLKDWTSRFLLFGSDLLYNSSCPFNLGLILYHLIGI